jgi:hypothetical protein
MSGHSQVVKGREAAKLHPFTTASTQMLWDAKKTKDFLDARWRSKITKEKGLERSLTSQHAKARSERQCYMTIITQKRRHQLGVLSYIIQASIATANEDDFCDSPVWLAEKFALLAIGASINDAGTISQVIDGEMLAHMHRIGSRISTDRRI